MPKAPQSHNVALGGVFQDRHYRKVIMWKGKEKGKRSAKLSRKREMKETMDTAR